ncbi:oligosaccharide flippase family protein [Halapricum sp. CBA1109]|uniref:flippase n=1 Tax=Halapricum sp. CBA1109 TaxID=2668068 RepID=UPI0012F9653F|nr:flippase [Halapricum sp. CBA1109]MUV90047.1 oligosaccharide flippase family protein [Halapricum sp. CBA1109]
MADGDDAVRSLVKGSGIIFAGFVLENGLAFVTKVLMARLLGKTGFGELSIGIILAANVSTIFVLGLNTGVARYLPRYDDPAKRRGVLVSAFRVVVPVVVVVGALIVVFAEPIARIVVRDPSVAPVIRVFGLATPLAAIMKLAVGAIQGIKDSTPKVYVRNIVQPMSRSALVVVVLLLGLGALEVSWAYFGSYLLSAAVAMYFVYRRTELFADTPATPMYRELLSFSGPLAVMAIASLIVSGIGIDTFMIAFFNTTDDVGEYNVVMPTAKLMILVLSSLSFLFMPIMSELHAEGASAEMERIFRLATKWIVLATLPILVVMVVFPREFIALTFGSAYTTASLSLTVLAVGFFFHSAFGLGERVLNSVGSTRVVMADNIAAAAVNVALNLLLIPSLSVLGAAIGTAAAYVTLDLLYLYHVHDREGMHPFTSSLVRPAVSASPSSAARPSPPPRWSR